MKRLDLDFIEFIIDPTDWGIGLSVWGNGYKETLYWQVTIQVLCLTIEIPIKK